MCYNNYSKGEIQMKFRYDNTFDYLFEQAVEELEKENEDV